MTPKVEPARGRGLANPLAGLPWQEVLVDVSAPSSMRRPSGAGSRRAVRWVLAACALHVFLLAHGDDGGRRYDIDIRETDAPAALRELAEQTESLLLFPFELAQDRRANPVAGRYTIEEALARLLDGSGLTGVLTNQRVISVVREEPPVERGEQMTATAETTVPPAPQRAPLLRRIGATIAAVLAAPGAFAQSDDSDSDEQAIEVIIVTAEKREESILEVPVTMTAFTSEFMEEMGMSTNADIEALTPGVQLAEDGDFNLSSLRGIQTVNARETNSDLSVATYVDGVYTVDSFGLSPNLFDLERLEIARGPQGTLHGRNSIGGSLSYVHKRPTDEWDLDVLAQFTDQVTQRFNVAFGGPLTDTLSYRLTGGYHGGDGATENLGAGDDYDAPDLRSVAPQVRLTTDLLDVNLRYQHVRDTGIPDVHTMLSEPNREDSEFSPEWYGYRVNIPSLGNCRYDGTAAAEAFLARYGYHPQPDELWAPLCDDPEDKILANRSGMTDSTSDRFTVSADWHITDSLTVRYVGGNSKADTERAGDNDLTSRVPDPNNPLVAADNPVPFLDQEWHYHFNSEETSHELQLISNLDGPLDFIVGAYAYSNNTRWQYDVYDYTPFSAHPERTWPRFVDVDARARELGFADCADYLDNWYTTFGGWFPTWEVSCPETDDHKVWLTFFNLADNDTLAAFANAEYQLNDNWRVAGGIRWTEDDKSLVVRGHYLLDTTLWAPPWAGIPLSLDMTALWAGDSRAPRAWDATIGHISAEYTPDDGEVMYYGRISTGYRAGGFEGAEITLQEYFDAETLINYEAGVKGLFLDGRLQLTASGFYNTYDDFQFQAVQEIDRIFAPTGETRKLYAEYTENIDGTEIWGAEVEATFYADERWRFSGFYAYLGSSLGTHEYPVGGPNAEYREVAYWSRDSGSSTRLLPAIVDVSGNQLPQQPPHKGALVAQYTLPLQGGGALQFLTAYSFVGDRYIDIGNDPEYSIPGFSRWDIRGTWQSQDGKWSTTGYVQNVLDKVGIRETLAQFQYGKTMGRLTPPRRIGLEVRYKR